MTLDAGADLAKVYGESTRCPACGAFAKVQPHPEHRWVCGVCGAPRVVMPEGEPVPEETSVALREANAAIKQAAFQRFLAWGLGVPAGFVLMIAIMLASASFVIAGVTIAIGVVLAILASRASRKGSTERKRVRGAVERAYEAAIEALATKDKTPREIATALKIAEADVEAALAVSGGVRIADVAPKRIAEPEPEPEPEAEAEAGAEKKA